MKAVIIGGGAKRRYVDFEDFDKRDVEFWGFNAIRKPWVLRWDRMFNIHKFDLLKRYNWPVEIEAEWAATNRKVPFYVADEWPEGWLPNQKIFPRGEMRSMPRGDYHCNSLDWLIAYAIHERFDEIEVHGFMLSTEGISEQMSARACGEYWIGFAEGMGIKVTMAKDCDLFYAFHVVRSNRVYGYEDCPAWEDKSRDAEKGPPYKFGDK